MKLDQARENALGLLGTIFGNCVPFRSQRVLRL